MQDHVYKLIEIVGTSHQGIDHAIETALKKARESLRNVRWFEVTSTRAGTFATFVGLTDAAGKPAGGGFPDPNLRPQIVGVFTDLSGPAPPGLTFSATIDTRFSTAPTTLKLLAMVLAIVSTIVALIALWRLDQLDGRRMRRWIPTRWRKFTVVDATVIFGFLLWHGWRLGLLRECRCAAPCGRERLA